MHNTRFDPSLTPYVIYPADAVSAGRLRHGLLSLRLLRHAALGLLDTDVGRGMAHGDGRHRKQIVQPELRFLFARFTMHPMDNTTSLPEFLVRLPEGIIRVTGTRVSVDSVVRAFQDGATPEEICLDFPSLDLAKVYNILAYYLTRRETIDAYLLAQQQLLETTRQELQARHSPFLGELRRRVAARRALPPACA